MNTRSYLPFLIVFLWPVLAAIGHDNPSMHESYGETPITLTISGTNSFCYTSNFTTTYTVTNLSTGTFTWNVPGNCTILSGQGTSSVTIQFNSPNMGMNISVTNSDGSSGNISVSAYGQPSGSISGPSSVCAGQTGVSFSANGGPNFTGFSWTATNGATFASSSTIQNVTVNFPSNYTGGIVSATLLNGPCVGSTAPKNITIGGTLPSTPGTISGSTTVAPGQTGVAYSVGAVANATSYSWSLPSGASIASGGGTNSITVNFSTSFAGGTMSVAGSNSVCSGASSPGLTIGLSVLVGPAGNINGPSTICSSSNGGVVTYSVPAITNATSYLWSFDGNVYPNDQYSSLSTINLNFSQVNSNVVHITVQGFNSYGGGTVSNTFSVNAYRPAAAAGSISGTPVVCSNQTGVPYSIPTIANVTSYTWTLPAGATIASGNGTNSITVNFSGFTSGTIAAAGVSGLCGPGSYSTLPITLQPVPAAAGTITGTGALCAGMSNITYSVPAIANATGYVWSLPTGASINTGANTNNISVNFSSSATSGNVSVYGTNCMGNGASSNFPVTIFNGPPAALGPIQGQTGVCENSTLPPYSVTLNSSATSYNWFPSGGPASISIPSPGSASFTFQDNYPTSGITVHATGVNPCGIGPESTLDVTVFKKPSTAPVIHGSTTVCPGQNSVPYSVDPIANTNSINWSPSTGLNVASGYGTNSITVNVASNFTGGQIVVQGVDGACGTGPATVWPLSLTTQAPASPGTITQSVVCPNVVYSVPNVIGVNYVWSIPPTATIVSGAGTNSITVSYSVSASGNVSVYGTNCAGSSPASLKPVSATPLPDAAGSITGSQSVCPGQNNVSYTVPLINNATGYTWSVPANATIISGQNTNSISVNFSTQSGNISVYGTGCGGVGPTSQPYPVSVLPTPNNAGVITGKTVACNQTGVVYSIQPIANATGYVWTVPSGATIVSGQNTTSIAVNFSGTTQAGNVTVSGTIAGSTCLTSGQSSSLPVNTGGGPEVKHSVDFATGTMSAALPLFDVSDGDVTVPISLLYTALGVKVTDDDGWLGHNWSVSTQSLGIFREMRGGLPDDYLVTTQPDPLHPDNRVGWLNNSTKTNIKNFIPSTDNDPSTCTDEVSNFNFLNTLNSDQDTEPDAFHVALPGLAFDFYFDENNLAQVVPYTDVIITPNTTSGPISSFTIKDSNGVTYYFTENETMTQSIFQTNPYFLVRLSNTQLKQFTFTTAWRLTSITSPVYGTVNLTYSTIQSSDNDLMLLQKYRSSPWYSYYAGYVYRYPLIISNSQSSSGSVQYYRSSVMKVLTGIISPSMEAEFVSVPKSAGSILQRLQTINLYEKRAGSRSLVKQYNLSYMLPYMQSGQRAFLSNVNLKISCVESNYHFDYNFDGGLPDYNSSDKDAWDLYKIKNFSPGMRQYDETAASGSLRKITQPLGGYTIFFYETHDYWDGSTSVQGGGIRLKKIIRYDAVSSANDVVQDFSYKALNGNSSGKLQHKNAFSFSVVKLPLGGGFLRYRDQALIPNTTTAQVNAQFTVSANQDLAHSNELKGSAVAYSRVTVKTQDAGSSVYEYDLPASYQETSANSNEWVASKVMIARPRDLNNTSVCYDNSNISEGYNRYPFPVNPPYNFARGLLTKVTDLNTSGTPVHDVVYQYQRVYKGSGVNKVYGLALEELPTYYYNGSTNVETYYNGSTNVPAKMFLYSKYELYTNVKTELSQQTETIYNSSDLSSKTQVITNYYFDSPNHQQLSRTSTQHSDGSVTISRIKYVQDFIASAPADAASTAIKGLNNSHRVAIAVESTSSKMISGTEKYLGASLTVFQTGNASKVYPYQTYHYVSNDGSGGFVPSSISSNAFAFDNTHYVLDNTFISFDNFGNPLTVTDGSKDIHTTAYGYNGTVPIVSVSHAGSAEVLYSDFETSNPTDFFITWGSPTYGAGMNSPQALNIPTGSSTGNRLTNSIVCNRTPWYIFSGWVKATSSGTLNIQVASTTYTYNFTGSAGWSYCRLRIPTNITGTNSFTVTIWSSTDAQLDDLVLVPEQADFKGYTYQLPFGKTSEKDARGNYRFYDYDPAGRLNAIYDKNKNVIKKYEYQ